MGILEDILSELQEIKAALAGSAMASAGKATGGTAAKAGTAKAKDADKGPTLEAVQDLIRGLVAADADNKVAIKKAIKTVDKTAERAGDFEGQPAKLKKLFDALTALSGGDEEEAASDDDDDML